MSSGNTASVHIFLFPFMWDCINEKGISNQSFSEKTNIAEFIQSLKGNWSYDSVKPQTQTEYNEYVYFYDNVRDAIFNRKDKETAFEAYEDQTVFNFSYKLAAGTYKIDIASRKSYELVIDSIRLKLYDTGIGIISFHLLNEADNLTQEDILQINEFGRRIYPQFLPIDEVKKNHMLADKLTLTIDGNVITEDFNYDYIKNPNRVSATIMDLLGDKFLNTGDMDQPEAGTILVRPIIDDRMFTMCWYGNDEVSSHIKAFKENLLENKAADYVYKYVFVDTDYVTCQNDKLQSCLLDKHTYLRWSKYGTLFGMTRYSFMVLTDTGDFSRDTLSAHLRTMYYEMVCLVLAQKASILRFSQETTRAAIKHRNNISRKVMQLQKSYIKFINKVYFREVTAQDQGIELYNKLIEVMCVEREIGELNREIDELHSYMNLMSDKKTNKTMSTLTTIGSLFIIPSFITSLLGMNIYVEEIKRVEGLFNIFTLILIMLGLSAASCLFIIYFNQRDKDC